jgi:hypothetical protein
MKFNAKVQIVSLDLDNCSQPGTVFWAPYPPGFYPQSADYLQQQQQQQKQQQMLQKQQQQHMQQQQQNVQLNCYLFPPPRPTVQPSSRPAVQPPPGTCPVGLPPAIGLRPPGMSSQFGFRPPGVTSTRFGLPPPAMVPPPTGQTDVQPQGQEQVLHGTGAPDVQTTTPPAEPLVTEESNADEPQPPTGFKPPALLSLRPRYIASAGFMRPGGLGLRGGPFQNWRGPRPLLMEGFSTSCLLKKNYPHVFNTVMVTERHEEVLMP